MVLEVVQFILGLGPTVMLPIVITIIGMAFGQGFNASDGHTLRLRAEYYRCGLAGCCCDDLGIAGGSDHDSDLHGHQYRHAGDKNDECGRY